MTLKEIVDGLQFTLDMFLFDPTTGETYPEPRNDMDKITIDACKGAIELLKQQPCEDCISRQYLIERATSWDKHFADSERYVSLTEIQNAPPVTPQPKKGKWIGEENLDGSIHYMCDNCKEFEYVNYYDFCPNCGADMRESEDKE